MGRDLEQYVHPERISSQLICPICTQVLKNPVQTVTEHLFCEEELLEWMTRSNLCPITKAILNPSEIKKPSRIILNMLAELEIYCNYHTKGCQWIGTDEQLATHLEKECLFHQNAILQETVDLQAMRLQETHESILQLELKNHQLTQENELLKALVDDYQQRLRLFHALLPENSNNARHNVITASDDEVEEDQDVSIDADDYEISRGFYQRNFAEPAEQKYEAQYLSSAHNSPGRIARGSSGSSSRKVSDAERLQRLQGLRSFNSTAEEGKDYERKENRK